MILLSIIALVGWGLAFSYMWLTGKAIRNTDSAIECIKELKAEIERLERNGK